MGVTLPEAEFTWSFARSGGPGGQNVNKVSSKAILRWNVVATQALPPMVKARLMQLIAPRLTKDGDLLIVAQEYRDQGKNQAACRAKLAELLRRAATPPKVRRATKPTAGSQRRRREAKRQQSERKAARRTGHDVD